MRTNCLCIHIILWVYWEWQRVELWEYWDWRRVELEIYVRILGVTESRWRNVHIDFMLHVNINSSKTYNYSNQKTWMKLWRYDISLSCMHTHSLKHVAYQYHIIRFQMPVVESYKKVEEAAYVIIHMVNVSMYIHT